MQSRIWNTVIDRAFNESLELGHIESIIRDVWPSDVEITNEQVTQFAEAVQDYNYDLMGD